MHVGACYWGYNKPGCFLWADILESGRVYVRQDFKFSHRTIEDVALEVKKRTAEMGVSLSSVYAGDEMFGKATESKHRQAETLAEVFGRLGIRMTRIDGDRQHGWQRVHDFLRLGPDGKPVDRKIDK